MKTLTRDQTIDGLRRALLELVDDDHSMCQVAGQKGIMCRGFRQFTDAELEERYGWLVKRRGPKSREEIEDLANRWQIARQLVCDTSLSCDTQTREHDTCWGWDTYSDDQLREFYLSICGEEITITRRG
jgi:hypothetical protein